MRVSKFTQYAVDILIFMATQKPLRLFTISQTCEALDLPRSHVSKIIWKLESVGIIETRRGRRGGMRLVLSPDAIPLGWLMGMIELKMPDGIFEKASIAFEAKLNEITIADLIEESSDV